MLITGMTTSMALSFVLVGARNRPDSPQGGQTKAEQSEAVLAKTGGIREELALFLGLKSGATGSFLSGAQTLL